MTSKKAPHTFTSDIQAIVEKVGKQLKKEHAAFKKSIHAYVKKPESRIAEFVILFLVVGILFSLFALLDGWLQTFIKAAEDNNAVIEVSVEKTDENCRLGEAEYDISAKLVDSDSGDVEIKAYEIAFDLTNYSLAADAVDFEIGADEDDVSNYDDGIVRGFIDGREQVLAEGSEGTIFLKLRLQKEDYEDEQRARCSLQQIDEQADYVALLDRMRDAFEEDDKYKQFIQDGLIGELSSEAVNDATASILEDEEYSDNQVVVDLAENVEGDETPTKAEVTEVISDQDDIDDITKFVAEILSLISSSHGNELESLASTTKETHEETYTVDIRSRSSTFFAKTINEYDEFEIHEVDVVAEGEANGGSGTEDGSSGAGSSGESGSSDDSDTEEESSAPQRGTGDDFDCKERPEKGADPAGVCGCVGEDCGFGDNDDNRYDWRCCHRAWGACQNDGKRACITVFGEGQSHACEVGKVEECVPQSQVDEVQDRKDSLFCEGEPPNIAQPVDGAGKPSCFLRDGDNWVTCATNEKCREVGEKTGANWCYGGYCGRP
jgi:hypothetical protein